jgi:hypothetical protein
MHTQRNVPGSSKQLPSFWHGCDSHSLMFVSHLGPVKPWLQLQAKEPGIFTQMPLCSQGDPLRDNTKRKVMKCYAHRRRPGLFTLETLVNIFRTIRSFITLSAGACEGSIYRTCLANSISVARIGCTSIFQMAQKSSLSRCTSTTEASYSIDARCTIKASSINTVVDIFTTIVSSPAIDAYASIASM